MADDGRELRVGMFSLVGLVLMCGLVLLYGEEPTWFWRTHWLLEIRVTSPQGVGEGTPAFLEGVQVGRVQSIRLRDRTDPAKGAIVMVEIEEDFVVLEGTEATLHPSFGFDKGSIHLRVPQVHGAPLPTTGGWIQGKAVGALETVVPEEFILKLVEAVDKIGELSGKFGDVAVDLHNLLEERSMNDVDSDARLVANLSTVIQRIDASVAVFREVLEDGGQNDLQVMLANAREISKDLKNWTGQLEPRTSELMTRATSSLDQIDGHLDKVAISLVERLDQLSGVIDQTYLILKAVHQGEGTAGLVLKDPRLYEEMVDSFAELQLLIADLKGLVVWVQTDSMLRGPF